ncbi:MAG TPA: hypothetical protein VMS55_14730 [Myxococcota bacterium]|nr:hypothetical protein [Myxococcota bacterium]
MSRRILETTRARAQRRQSGAALLITMLLLTAMALIGFASLHTVMRDREATGFTSQSQTALYGADAALAASLKVLHDSTFANAVGVGTCLATPIPSATLPNGVTYGPDPTAPNSNICMLAPAGECTEMGSSIEQGQPNFLHTVWNVRTQGVAPGGATSRIQATVERCNVYGD